MGGRFRVVRTMAAAKPVEYLVKNGDTLYRIAKAHDVSVKALAEANGKTLGRFVPIMVRAQRRSARRGCLSERAEAHAHVGTNRDSDHWLHWLTLWLTLVGEPLAQWTV